MKKYFLQFDFWNENINKFYFGCITADIARTDLTDICKQIISEEFNGIYDDVDIKVNALNNVDF